MAFPRAWVDAAAGTTATDAEGLKTYWLERLAPPARHAARPLRDRRALEVDGLLDADEAARRITADARYLARLAGEGTLPALRVDGEARYDPVLTELVAAEDDPARVAARRAAVADWSRYEYADGLDEGRTPPPSSTRPAPAPAVAVAPRAWHLPAELVQAAEAEEPAADGAGPGLAEAEGYETVDEDD